MSTKTKRPKTIYHIDDDEVKPISTPNVKQLCYGEYYNIFSGMMHPITISWVKKEADQLMAWSTLDTSLRIYDYTDLQGYTPKTYAQLINAHPEIREANDFAIRRIASRRELGGLNRTYDSKVLSWTQGHYDPIFREQQRELAAMKDEQLRGSMQMLVEMTTFPRLPGNDAPVKIAEIEAMTPEEVVQKTMRGVNPKPFVNPSRTRNSRYERTPEVVAKKVKDSTVKGSGCRSEFKKTKVKHEELDEEAT